MKVWLNGALVAEADARISPFDHGLLVGDGVFETLRVIDGVPFAVRRHLDRLAASAAGLGLTAPPADELVKAMQEVVDANDGVGRLRVTLTAGPGPLGSGRGGSAPTVLVTGGAPAQWEPSTAVVVAPWPRNERGALAGLKTISYADNVRALAWAHERDASEALLANLAGNLCEGTGTNVFVALDGALLTPPLSAGCLAGVTRALLVELGVGREAEVPMGALADAEEMFLASSTRDVHPISHVDGRPLPRCPGPLTTAAAAAFADLVARDLDP